MAKRLTEEMVIARTKISDLSKIKRLNCWGSELVDLTLLKRMPCVEVLSFSVNKINSLEDFQYCKRLEELYIRQNNIRDLNQILYLKNLPNLKNLWLGENPCASADGYRLAVLRALPQLQKLDNVAVSDDELREASRRGRVLLHPDDPEASDEEEYAPVPRSRGFVCCQEYSPPMTPERQDSENEAEEVDEYYTREVIRTEDQPPPPYSTVEEVQVQRVQELVRRNQSPVQTNATVWRRNSNERETPPQQQYNDRSPPSTNANEEHVHTENYREIRLVTSHSTNSIKEYMNGDRYTTQPSSAPWDRVEPGDGTSLQRRDRPTCSASIRPPFNRRPVTRNSNILSAVLCLVKELDYPSLEVVEMAVRCRMDELDE